MSSTKSSRNCSRRLTSHLNRSVSSRRLDNKYCQIYRIRTQPQELTSTNITLLRTHLALATSQTQLECLKGEFRNSHRYTAEGDSKCQKEENSQGQGKLLEVFRFNLPPWYQACAKSLCRCRSGGYSHSLFNKFIFIEAQPLSNGRISADITRSELMPR